MCTFIVCIKERKKEKKKNTCVRRGNTLGNMNSKLFELGEDPHILADLCREERLKEK